MNEQEFQYEVPKNVSVRRLNTLTQKLLQNSQAEVVDILRKHGIAESDAKAVAAQVTGTAPEAEYKGAGSVADVVAIAISLVPLIKALTPLLLPFSKKGAELAYEIGKDIWLMLKQKLLGENVRLKEKNKKKKKKSQG